MYSNENFVLVLNCFKNIKSQIRNSILLFNLFFSKKIYPYTADL